MIRDKRKLQLYTCLALSLLILCLGFLSTSVSIALLRDTLEKQMAEDSEVIAANLRIIIGQVTRDYTDRNSALQHIQKVLEALNGKGWRGFACVLDKNGRVLAHPRPEFIDMQVPLETYEPTDLLGSLSPSVHGLPGANATGIYRTPSDVIAIQWLPGLMTYLCVHQSIRAQDRRVEDLRRTLALIGLGIIAVAVTGAWIFVGKLVDRYESNLARSEARNRALVQNSAPILVVDPAGQVLDANPQAETLCRAPRDRLLQMRLQTLWPPAEDLLRAVSREDVVERHDLDISTADGKSVPVDLRACRITYGNREAIYLLLRNITESRRAKEEMLEVNRKLRELDQLKTDFLNTVSHELRTPLTSIKWSTESLATLVRPHDNPTIQKLLNIIRDDNQRLSVLIEQLLSFSRMDAGKLEPHPRPLNLPQVLTRAREEVDVIAQKKGVRFDLSPHVGAPHLHADPEQLHQVLVNILDNAIKYTPPGGRVCVCSRTAESRVEITIEDTGIGIPEKDRAHIFEKFYRTDQSEVQHERGTGLGLAIVRGIVDAHGGNIDVKSTLGRGTTFTIRLPQDGTPEIPA